MIALTELAERVEKLTGPCRETDALITVALNVRPDWAKDDPARLISEQIGRVSLGRHGASWGANDYTASLDAAMTLYLRVPERVPSDPRKAVVEALRQRSNEPA